MCVCVCVCERLFICIEREGLINRHTIFVWEILFKPNVKKVWLTVSMNLSIDFSIDTQVYRWVCVCMCVCICVFAYVEALAKSGAKWEQNILYPFNSEFLEGYGVKRVLKDTTPKSSSRHTKIFLPKWLVQTILQRSEMAENKQDNTKGTLLTARLFGDI